MLRWNTTAVRQGIREILVFGVERSSSTTVIAFHKACNHLESSTLLFVSDQNMAELPPTNSAWIVLEGSTSVTELTRRTFPVLSPGARQVLVRLAASSLNYRDILVATHSPHYPVVHKPDLVTSGDGAGVIHSAHPTSSWAGKEGTAVVLHPNRWLIGDVRNLSMDGVFGAGDADGTLQEWFVVDDDRVVEAPKGLSGVESATLITAGVTAWAAVRGWMNGRLDGGIEP